MHFILHIFYSGINAGIKCDSEVTEEVCGRGASRYLYQILGL